MFTLSMQPDQFAQQIVVDPRALQSHRTRRLSAAITATVFAQAVALTFDDGYLDNLTIAAPILHTSHSATFFVTTAGLEQPREYRSTGLRALFSASSALQDTLTLEVNWPVRSVCLRSIDPWQSGRCTRSSSDVSEPLDQVLGEFEELLEPRAPPAWRPMTGEKVHELASYLGVTIRAHTANHLSLLLRAQTCSG